MVLCLRVARLRGAIGCEESEVTEAYLVAGGCAARRQAGRQGDAEVVRCVLILSVTLDPFG
eukprot:COSAG06_NODE_11925_length_1446_cov_2.002970_3_plen_61_part_00